MVVAGAPVLGEPLPVELMNTVWADRDGVHDRLATPPETAAWVEALAGRADVHVPGLRFWSGTAGPGEVERVRGRLVRLRDAARGLAALRTHDPRPVAEGAGADDIATLNELAATAPMAPVLEWPEGGGPRLGYRADDGAGDTAVAELARATVRLLAGDSESLRACLAPGCVLYFVQSHPRREWCSPACGNRARQARHYRRHRAEGTAEGNEWRR